MSNLLGKLAAFIYCKFVLIFHVRVAPPTWLFNQPATPTKLRYWETILADPAFTNNEREIIREAFRNIEYFFNGFIRFNVNFNWDPKQKLTEHQKAIVRATSDHPTIKEADKHYRSRILGLCTWNDGPTIIIYLIPERLNKFEAFRTVCMHETCHYLGMGHIKPLGIMHPYNCWKALFMTRHEAEAFGKIFNLPTQSFRYFKR